MASDARPSAFHRHCRKPRYIYALCEPDKEFAPGYVGCCRNPVKRLQQHKTKPHCKATKAWMESVGNNPKVVILGTASDWWQGCELEKWWIWHLNEQGYPLVNKANREDVRDKYRLMRDAAAIRRRVRRDFNRAVRGNTVQPLKPGTFHQGRLVTHNGKTQGMAAWGRELGVSRERVRQLLAKHPPEIALLPRGERQAILRQQFADRVAARRAEREEARRQRRDAKDAARNARRGLSHRHRKLRREMMAIVFAGDAQAVANQFGVTTVTVNAALKQFGEGA